MRVNGLLAACRPVYWRDKEASVFWLDESLQYVVCFILVGRANSIFLFCVIEMEYTLMALCILGQNLSEFFNPIAINRLLK